MKGRRDRRRLDQLLVDRGLAPSRSQAQALILAGRVSSQGQRLEKPGVQIDAERPLELAEGRTWVSRGAHKLGRAIESFNLDLSGRLAADIGSSTGGFTQQLLRHGAAQVIAVDVGRGQLDWGLRQDERVTVMEGVNARYLTPEQLPFSPQIFVMDVSFISIEKVLPALVACLADGGEIVTLVKPQFEVGRGNVGRGGIVRDSKLHVDVLDRILRIADEHGWGPQAYTDSPIRGADGNREFLVHLQPGRDSLAYARERIQDWVETLA